MALFGIFSKKKKTAPSRPKDAQATVFKLRESIAHQDKREEHIQRKINESIDEAKKKMARGNKKGAVFAMKRKKLYEKELDKIMNVKMTLDTQAIQLESGAGNISIFKAMKQGNSSLAWIHKKLGIDKVDDTMDDIREEMDRAQEINTAIGQPVDPLLCDDDELLAELNSLEASEMEPSKRDGRLSLPTVPFFNRLPQSSKTDEDDYKRLQAELAM